MGKAGYSRRSTAQSTTHGSPRRPRGDGRLDPVRWRRPGRGPLIRLVAVAALLATAAAASWSSPRSCGAPTTGRAASPAPPSHSARSPAPTAGTAVHDQPGPAASSEDPDRATQPVPEGSVGVPIRLADPTALSLVHPGNHVDLLRIDGADGHPTPVAGAALVLRVTGTDPTTGGGLLLALTPQEAQQAVVTSREGFAIVIRPD